MCDRFSFRETAINANIAFLIATNIINYFTIVCKSCCKRSENFYVLYMTVIRRVELLLVFYNWKNRNSLLNRLLENFLRDFDLHTQLNDYATKNLPYYVLMNFLSSDCTSRK